MMKWIMLALCLPLSAQDVSSMSPRETYVTHKTAHALVGIGVAWAGHELGYPKTGIACAWGLGIAKELYDRKHGGRFRVGDVIWTGAPATVFSVSVRW